MRISILRNYTNIRRILINKNIRALSNDASKGAVTKNKNDKIDEVLDKLPLTQIKVDASELDKYEWERSTRNNVFHGFDIKNVLNDKRLINSTLFLFIGVFCIFGGVVLWYKPDHKNRHWAVREAHLELSRRRQAGEPLINPNYVPPETIKLPTEEEIGDMEISI